MRKDRVSSLSFLIYSVHERIRTSDLPLRRRSLYPTELRRHIFKYLLVFLINFPHQSDLRPDSFSQRAKPFCYHLSCKIHMPLKPYHALKSAAGRRLSQKILLINAYIQEHIITVQSYNINVFFGQTVFRLPRFLDLP